MPLEIWLLGHPKFQENTKIWVVTRLKKTIPVTNVGIRSSQQINIRKLLKSGQLCNPLTLNLPHYPWLWPMAREHGPWSKLQDPQVVTATGENKSEGSSLKNSYYFLFHWGCREEPTV